MIKECPTAKSQGPLPNFVLNFVANFVASNRKATDKVYDEVYDKVGDKTTGGSARSVARPIPEHGDKVVDGRTLCGANVVAAGGDACKHTKLVVQTKQFAEAKTGIEMVAGARRDHGRGDEWPIYE